MTYQLEDPQNSVDMPPFVGRESLGREGDLGRHTPLELIVGRFKEGEQFADHDSDVLLVDERVAELESSTADGDIAIAKAVKDDGSVSLNGGRIYRDDLGEGVESDISERSEYKKHQKGGRGSVTAK